MLPWLPLADNIKDRYEKLEYRISMRDGVELYTAVYVPRHPSGPFPILMERTPYSAAPYGKEEYARIDEQSEYTDAGYAIAYQDVRGTHMSGGNYENVRPVRAERPNEAADTYDTVDWLVKNVPGNNGKVGLRGISYPGFYAAIGAIGGHPALKAVSPQAPVSDFFLGDDVYHRGAFFLQDNWEFSSWFDYPRKGLEKEHHGLPDLPPLGPGGAYGFYLRMGNAQGLETEVAKGRVPFWKTLIEHDAYDSFWRTRALPAHMRDVKCAVLTVGGLFDAENLYGALNVYGATERQNPGIFNVLALGPWWHGQWFSNPGRSIGGLDFGSDTAQWFRRRVEFPFFERFLKGGPDTNLAEATVFETGANRWRLYDSWPPKGLKPMPMYLDNHNALVTTLPTREAADTYVNDPNAPTPYLAKPETAHRPSGFLAQDEAWNARRDDVLTYQSAPLASRLEVAGPIDADVWVTTTGTDMDLIVKVLDVWPAGSPYAGQMRMVRSEVIRGRYRDSFTKAKPFLPNTPARIRLRLNDVLHSFEKGHRVGVMIQSSWFPLVDRNPNQFISAHTAKPGDYKNARIRVLRGGRYPSQIVFNTL